MNVDLIAVDKMRQPYLREGCQLYLERLHGILPVSVYEVPVQFGTTGVELEGERMLRRVASGVPLWVLDASGTSLTSPALADKLAAAQHSGARRLALVIGGDRGVSAALRSRADFVWSLSPLTFLHEMARLIVLEQLYRAVKIQRGEPYHRA
ncbi:MAG: 23S rRNA (pseudouridine(1915)-N(3))-methyltransferase RlmH [Candidatus Eremiobacteraeota bacterium]|nr:23S rRNA (pseudouridine(1915)-N(3))-methyltransferase RlmH [Candidatus Eremiobacteraeota bacterium]